MTASLESGCWTRSEAQKRRLEEVPSRPPASLHAKMASVPVWLEPRLDRPCWVSSVCHHRQHFKDSVFFVSADAGDVAAYKFMYAMQNPLKVVFCRLHRQLVGPLAGCPLTWETAHEFFLASEASHFQVDWTNIVEVEDLPSHDIDCIDVLSFVYYREGDLVSTCARPEALELVLSRLGAVRDSSRKASGSAHGGATVDHADLLAQFPWLSHMFENKKREVCQGCRAPA